MVSAPSPRKEQNRKNGENDPILRGLKLTDLSKTSTFSKILAIETTDAQGGVALCEDGEIVAFEALPLETRSARSLAPAIRALLSNAGRRPEDVDAVAVAVGPGSFTGLRVGVATAKMFAWAIGAKIVGVDSLEAIASETTLAPSDADGSTNKTPDSTNWGNGAVLSVGLDAQRGDAAVRRFWIARDGARAPIPLDERFRVVPFKEWLNVDKQVEFNDRFDWEKNAENKCFLESGIFLNDANSGERKNVYFCGPALNRCKNRTTDEFLRAAERFVDEKYWAPTARGVAKVAWRRLQRGEFDDVWRMAPVYSRKAAAEERALEKAAVNKDVEQK